MTQHNVLDHGFVRLDGQMGDDLSVVNAARVSFGVTKIELDDADKGLIKFLMRERHGTPFEHNAFRFHVRCPIFVAREWFRHRIGSFNELSGRYKEIPTVAYMPAPHDVRTQVGKPGSYTFEPVDDYKAFETIKHIEQAYEVAFRKYNKMLEEGIAKEIARLVLPMGTYTEFFWTVNARSLMNFLSLRLDQSAQYEIREFAQAVNSIFVEAMPITARAWIENGHNAP